MPLNLDENFYSIRCQQYAHRGKGFMAELKDEEKQFVLYYQEDTDSPSRESVLAGKIDKGANYLKKSIEMGKAEEIIDFTASIQIPLLPPMTGGFDGIDGKIWINNGMSTVHLSWWMDCPEEYKQVGELWQRIIDLKDV